jgi:hypothetical protein
MSQGRDAPVAIQDSVFTGLSVGQPFQEHWHLLAVLLQAFDQGAVFVILVRTKRRARR